MVLGHEISGIVAGAGKNVTRVSVGDRVTVDAVIGCGICDLCKRGRIQFCAKGFECGITSDGGSQDFLTVPEKNVYPIPDSMSFEEAAILDMEVYNAVEKCGIQAGESVLVLGAGPIGLIACQVAKILGAGQIILSDPLPDRLRAAEAIGMADVYHLTSDDGIENTQPETSTMDVVIDCAGTAVSTARALDTVRPCGRVLLYGVYEHTIDQFDMNQVVLKDLVIFGSQSDRTGWEKIIELVNSGALNLKALITHTFPLEDAPRAYKLVGKHEAAAIKAVLQL